MDQPAPRSDRRPHEWHQEDRVDHYTCGYCHVLATALARLTGWDFGVMWAGPDRRRDGVFHVFVLAPDGDALDIHGKASLDAMRARIAGPCWRDYPVEAIGREALAAIVAEEGLEPFEETDVDDAVEVVRRHPQLGPLVAAATGREDFTVETAEGQPESMVSPPF